jgi:hypothetical protein
LHNPEGQFLQPKAATSVWQMCAAAQGDTERVREIEAEIDQAAELGGLSEQELQEIQRSLEELR